MLWSTLVGIGATYGALGGIVRILSDGKDIRPGIIIDGWWDTILYWVSVLAMGSAAGVISVALLRLQGDSARGVALLAGIFGRQVLFRLFARQFGGGD